MANFNVGDKVVVSAKIKQANQYRFGLADNMKPFCGGIVTIIDRFESIVSSPKIPDDGCCYKIQEDNGLYNWASSMFSPLAKKEESHSTDSLKICVKTKRIMFNFKN